MGGPFNSSDEQKELNEILKAGAKEAEKRETRRARRSRALEEDDSDEFDPEGSEVQWATADGRFFIPASDTVPKLPPGCYEIQFRPEGGIVFIDIPIKTGELVRFPDANSDKVIEEIRKFWKLRSKFKEHNLLFKRGICLWGPPGSGKSSTIQFVMRDLIEQGGICIKFTDPRSFTVGMRTLRRIEKKTRVIVIMEDIDAILETYNESDVLNLLDGIDFIEDVVFLATTNYPEKLGERVINRPSRFDKRFKIGFPNAESRKLYFEHLFKGVDLKAINVEIDKWVEDTEDFSVAHMQELFIAVHVLGEDYTTALETLTEMQRPISSDHDDDSDFGFGNKKKKKK